MSAGDVDLEAGVLDRVAGEVLHARHGVTLHAARERRSHLADVMRILAVRLLRAAPRGVLAAVPAAVGAGLVPAAHDCAEGGLAVALAECCVSGPARVGAEASVGAASRADHALFGEGPSRVVVAVEPGRVREFEALMAESASPWGWIGGTGGERLRLNVGGVAVVDVALDRIEQAWRNGLERHLA